MSIIENTTIRARIAALREKMREAGIDVAA